ncbi:PfaD family polyunsaturated fatty acid/polyketide biosynthesis protein [Saccharothrix xinjiangensis]|uniref:PfaD family polyunsaturated fatty acid/polyketide biosynthesis protein n=1 Tax=Saccharothrix xinjiangensis TaxID=204798 RepID=A0ABV9Y051_9PSEU
MSAVTAPLPATDPDDLARLSHSPRNGLLLLENEGRLGAIGTGRIDVDFLARHGWQVTGALPALFPQQLGDPSFRVDFGLDHAYLAGEMANGISSSRMVVAMARAGMLCCYGAGGVSPDRVVRAVADISAALPGRRNWGVNLIHSPGEPAVERAAAELLVRTDVPVVSASAYLDLTPAVVLCAAAGTTTDATGVVARPRRLIAKVSRPEVARLFLRPAPAAILRGLVEEGALSRAEADLAARVPLADAVTVEADSGGHTDNRPLTAILPAVLELRDELAPSVHVGAAGGLGTPTAVAAAFAMGAAYVVTGSVNQLTVESGLSEAAKALLFRADVADTVMTPAADMFEMGVRLQVLRTGTMFASRAQRLYDLYCDHDSLESIPTDVLARLERDVFRLPVDEVWRQTRAFWAQRDPDQLDRAVADPRHRMALVFRWYLGRSSGWAVIGDPDRVADYQIWCGPALGAFNRWVKGSFLAEPGSCTVTQIGCNLMEGATVTTRAHQLRVTGRRVAPVRFVPRPLA